MKIYQEDHRQRAWASCYELCGDWEFVKTDGPPHCQTPAWQCPIERAGATLVRDFAPTNVYIVFNEKLPI